MVTYLAERISVGIEQTVSVGTLRRVLASNRWFIVLDGLDEVPQDVKDTLAEEILTFVDHVLVELDADVFTLCTSRPQGYSGQFDDLDAPTIMLVPLAPAHALACAAPVLALDRTDLEAQASLNLLKAAIESSAVRELMTSPLQSHIMAVVVRDGGRPPERRWQLFSNFYQVIRRREANKPLLDPRFAKLLREEEGLLKSVHNRLGFVLHARAERSAGAQTKMDRAEFRSIVMEAVMQMMDTDFERTVDTLMDATTERLVLVSTPDDGQHVRFDVRPLQEFFAAEFLYEAVGVDELRKRVEVIAGDAHWREVMHFLLSALIESGRRTELLVITRVLEALDDEDSEFGFRQIAKRMARGALLCSRLIEEGVVEQDKRYREQFVRSLQGLFGTVEVGLFTTLSAFRPGQSRKWFVRQLFAALKDFTPAENVGACLALCFILSDEDEDEGKLLKQHLLESPDSYLSYILFSTFIYTDEEASNPLKTWLASTSVTILSGQRWKELSPDTIRGITELLAMDRNLTLSVAADLGCNDAERTLLSEIVCAPEFSELRKAQYGRFQVFEYPQDWTTPFDFRSPELELAAYATGVSGYFELVQLVLRYARSRTANDLRTILMNHDRVHQILPRHLAALIPGGPRDLSELKTVGDESLRKLVTLQMLEGRYMRRPFYHFGPLLPSSSEPLEWLFLEYYPQHWADLLSGDSPDALHRRKKFTERLRNDPGLLCDCIADIPSLQELCPEIRDFIPSALRSVCAVAQPVSWPPRLPNVAVLEFPEDAPILPHIVAPAFARLRYYSEEEASNRTQRLIQWVERFFPDSSPLRVISDDVQQAPATRVAAIFLLLLHRSSGASLECDGERLVDLVVSSRTEWMIQALSVYLERFTDRKDPNAQKTVAHLLEATREDYPAREQVQWVITSWREESSAPVTDRGVLAAWLAEGT
ncbi:MAG TPA: hypothetical protein VJU82_12970 [Acidobacteriaceae bacterium]|nr:hypothetical protein [Acidobacteriaceae bacterium]